MAPTSTAHMGHPRVFARGQALARAGEGNAGDALQPGRALSRALVSPACSLPVPYLIAC